MSEHVVRIIIEGRAGAGVEIDRDPAEARDFHSEGPDYGRPRDFYKQAAEKVCSEMRADVAERLRNYSLGTTLKEAEGEKCSTPREPAIPRGMEKLEACLSGLSESITFLEHKTECLCCPTMSGTGLNSCDKVHNKSKFAEGIDSLIELVVSLDNRIKTINERLEV